MTMNHPTMPTTLTRTQRAALDDLLRTGRQWPMGRGRLRGDAPNSHCRYSRRTLQALVAARLAHWVARPGVMPHIEPGPPPRDADTAAVLDRVRDILTADNRGA